jgi:hypothetical protein
MAYQGDGKTNKDSDVAVGGDHCNDNGTTATEAARAADALITTMTAERRDDAQAPAPPLTHPSRAAPRTMSDNDDKDNRSMNKEVDNGMRTTTTRMTSTTSGGGGRHWGELDNIPGTCHRRQHQ